MLHSRCLFKQSDSSYIRHVRFGCQTAKNGNIFPLLERLNFSWENGKELGKLHLASELLHAISAKFGILLIKAGDFYINNLTKSTSFYDASICRGGEELLKKLDDLSKEFRELSEPSLLCFMNEKLAKVLDEERSIEKLYLNNM